MTQALLWFLTSPLPGLPTVSYAEAAWNLMAIVACGFAFWARSKWALVARNLTRATDRGAKAIARMLDWTCRGLIFLSFAEVVASLPGLRLPPRPDIGTSNTDLVTLALVPMVSFTISAGVVWLSVYMAEVTRRIGRGRYAGPDRRGPPNPDYDGPKRRATDRPATDPPSHERPPTRGRRS